MVSWTPGIRGGDGGRIEVAAPRSGSHPSDHPRRIGRHVRKTPENRRFRRKCHAETTGSSGNSGVDVLFHFNDRSDVGNGGGAQAIAKEIDHQQMSPDGGS